MLSRKTNKGSIIIRAGLGRTIEPWRNILTYGAVTGSAGRIHKKFFWRWYVFHIITKVIDWDR